MNNLDLASRPTLVQTTPPRLPGPVREGLKLAGQVIVSSVTAGCILMLFLFIFLFIGLFAAVIADLVGWC